ncbi:MAG: hypothetical protein RSH26_00240 [Clostridia bacterium]
MEQLKIVAPLDKAFEPTYRGLRAFESEALAANGPVLRIALERNDGLVATRDMRVLPHGQMTRAAFTWWSAWSKACFGCTAASV